MASESKLSARALASRQNGARSRGPKTSAGKAIASRNALKHGLTARRSVLLDGEDAVAFAEFQAALCAELAPAGVLQQELVLRIAAGLWRGRRSDRIEAALLARCLERAPGPDGAADLGLAVIRDACGPRALDTLLRYRSSAQAELFRGLGALKVLQAEAATGTGVASPGRGPATGEALRPGACSAIGCADRPPRDETNPRAAARLTSAALESSC